MCVDVCVRFLDACLIYFQNTPQSDLFLHSVVTFCFNLYLLIKITKTRKAELLGNYKTGQNMLRMNYLFGSKLRLGKKSTNRFSLGFVIFNGL